MAKWQLEPPEDDGLVKSKAKLHSEKKHYYLRRYIDAFTTAMKGKWQSICYIDLFAGAGIVEYADKTLTWGSPLIAAQSPVAFDQLIFCEAKKSLHDALFKRTQQLGLGDRAITLKGDANEVCHEVVRKIPNRSLSFAFLDPLGLHLNYETISTLSQAKCDLLVFFPDRVDLLRNWKLNYWENENSNPDLVFGPGADWRHILSVEPKIDQIRQLTTLYTSQVAKLGYEHSRSVRIVGTNGPLYQLIFFSKHEMGKKIWRGISEKGADGQHTFDFG